MSLFFTLICKHLSSLLQSNEKEAINQVQGHKRKASNDLGSLCKKNSNFKNRHVNKCEEKHEIGSKSNVDIDLKQGYKVDSECGLELKLQRLLRLIKELDEMSGSENDAEKKPLKDELDKLRKELNTCKTNPK